MPRQPSQSDTDSFLKQDSHFSLSLRFKITWLIRYLELESTAMQVFCTCHLITVDGRNLANQLRLVVYPIIYEVLHIPGGDRRMFSINSMVQIMNKGQGSQKWRLGVDFCPLCAFFRVFHCLLQFSPCTNILVYYILILYTFIYGLCALLVSKSMILLVWLKHAYMQQQGLPQQKVSDISLENLLLGISFPQAVCFCIASLQLKITLLSQKVAPEGN